MKEINHGTTSGYRKKCRCQKCKDANSAYERNRRSAINPDRRTRWPFHIELCRDCKIPKTDDNTGWNESLNRFNTYCKDCDIKRARKYRKENPLNNFKHDDLRRGFGENDLTLEFVLEAYENPCFYCGSSKLAMTLDRMDNNKGHMQSNVRPSCRRCNFIRKNMPYEAWEKLIPGLHEVEREGLFSEWTSCPKTFLMERHVTSVS